MGIVSCRLWMRLWPAKWLTQVACSTMNGSSFVLGELAMGLTCRCLLWVLRALVVLSAAFIATAGRSGCRSTMQEEAGAKERLSEVWTGIVRRS